jgi:fatty-acyl-CoA synthase
MHAGFLLRDRAQLTPQREALLDLSSGARYTYGALDARANRAAHWLLELGVQKGDRVSVLAHNSVVYVDLLFGCSIIGAVFNPLNWRLTAAELSYIVADCAPKVLLVGEAFAETAVSIQQQAHVEHVVPLDGYETAVSALPATRPAAPNHLHDDDPLCILYTSGTTGKPKGAIIPHRQVLWNAINTITSWELTSADVSPVFTPMFHAGGLFVFLTPLFILGGRVIIARDFDPAQSLQIIERERCTVILGVPTLFQLWLNSPQIEQSDLSCVRWFISGGAPCPPALITQWRQVTNTVLRQGYGLTEVGPNCFSMTDAESVTKMGSVGKPIMNSRMRLVDAQGHDVPQGETGELIIFGPHVCSGYWQRPQATAVALQNGWFHTGDMARQDEDGYFYIVGRYKDMIISGGENIYAAEVEAVLKEHTAVAECALIGKPDPKWGEVGLMVTVLHKGQQATEEELKAFCQSKLARYKVPKQIIFADALPYSPYGKVMKNELKKIYLGEMGS